MYSKETARQQQMYSDNNKKSTLLISEMLPPLPMNRRFVPAFIHFFLVFSRVFSCVYFVLDGRSKTNLKTNVYASAV